MKKILCITLAALVAFASCRAPEDKLVILHVNDTHSHFDPLRDGRCGIIERAVLVDSVRSARGESNVLLLHAGDFSQGSSYFTILHGDLEIEAINAMRYDCVTLGNHEFDNGIEDLGRRLSSLKCPVVCANYDFSPFEAGKYITPFAIVKKAGLKIGVVGLLCDLGSVVDKETADRLPRLGSDAEVADKWISYLKDVAGCDKVILLTHIGYEEDVQLAQQSSGADLVVGGHSHTLLDSLTVVKDASGRDVPVVTAECWGLHVGEFSF